MSHPSGNTETSTVNAAYDIAYHPQTRNVVKSDGLWIRGETDGALGAVWEKNPYCRGRLILSGDVCAAVTVTSAV